MGCLALLPALREAPALMFWNEAVVSHPGWFWSLRSVDHAAPSWLVLVLRNTVSGRYQQRCQLNGDVLCVLLLTARVASTEGCLHRCASTRLSPAIYLSAHARPVVRFNQGQISHSPWLFMLRLSRLGMLS